MPPATTALFLFLLPLLFSTSNAHNITRILAKHPEFSTFNHYLTVTHLAGEINRRETITVLALNNAAMSSLLSKQLSLYTLKNVLSLHVLVDYFGSKKLHQITDGTALISTMFQATGVAPGSSGYINVTDLKGGKVGFGAENNDGKLDAVYVKSVAEIPYNISVLQISQALNSAEAEAPAGEPSQLNLTAILSKQGCKAFADLLISSGADATFNQNIDGGLTVFCPTDPVIQGFMPIYKNLTASKKVSLLLYHGIPVYQSMQMLKSNNGIMNTLATDGAKKYDFTIQNDGEVVTLETKVVTAKITGTLKDEEPLIVYKINKVLLPTELFKPVEEAAPAESPKPAKSKSKHKVVAADAPESDAPAESDPADDQTADNENGVAGLDGGRLAMVLLSLCIGAVLM
ncbi:hypothetical protein V6N13_128022 [Hibiscus sabdariffa]|uniref:FAS1 domain-containing protein n=1 Tax=Hibiscus sabdariffa TaxID=183260 RepID=A0ABR2CGH8_9ROSI